MGEQNRRNPLPSQVYLLVAIHVGVWLSERLLGVPRGFAGRADGSLGLLTLATGLSICHAHTEVHVLGDRPSWESETHSVETYPAMPCGLILQNPRDLTGTHGWGPSPPG